MFTSTQTTTALRFLVFLRLDRALADLLSLPPICLVTALNPTSGNIYSFPQQTKDATKKAVGRPNIQRRRSHKEATTPECRHGRRDSQKAPWK